MMPNNKQQKRSRRRAQRPRPYPLTRRERNMGSNNPMTSRQAPFGVPSEIRDIPLFGYRYRRMIRYAEHVSLGTQNNATQGYVFAANGCYDPNITGTGHQPKGFDTIMQVYQHYQVLGARIEVVLTNDINQSLGGLSFAINVQRSTTVAGWTSVLESGNCVRILYPAVPEGGGPMPPFVRHAVKIADFQSIPDIMNDDTTKGTASANPATLVYFVLYSVCQDFGGTPTTNGVTADVVIEYDTIFTEPVLLGQS